MITSITTNPRNGQPEIFDVRSLDDEVINGHESIKFEIRQQGTRTWKHFVFHLVTIAADRRMVFMINNNEIPELSGKGIVKAMIEATSKDLNCDIVSSSNIPSIKIDEREGRIPLVTKFWQRWQKELDNVQYLAQEDRFIFNRKVTAPTATNE